MTNISNCGYVLFAIISVVLGKPYEYQDLWKIGVRDKSLPYNIIGPIPDEKRLEPSYDQISEDIKWKYNGSIKSLGQVVGVAVSNDETLFVFHRNDHVWDASTFDLNNIYKKRSLGPIKDDVVTIVNVTDGTVIKTWGKNMFYMPHGISIDPEGNVWLTDVALHQVFRFKKGFWDKPDVVIGEKFVPGSDLDHFCKPTDVAIASSGIAYVSDGYCNSRIVIVTPEGRVGGVFGTLDGMVVPHSLTLLESEEILCVADRENGRVMCYRVGMYGGGSVVFKISHPLFGRVMAVDHIGDTLFLLNLPQENGMSGKGITLDLATEELISTWEPQSGFVFPHDVTVSLKQRAFYVADVALESEQKIYKFKY